MPYLQKNDPELAALLQEELVRQQTSLELIPSENSVSLGVLEALGSVLTNKYSEGYPGKRYYGGNTVIDKIEELAMARAKKLFGAEHVNIQPYSGSPANHAAYMAVLQPGDTVMGMALPFGGHLTHGWKVNFSGKYYRSVQYATGHDGLLDYEEIGRLAREHTPKMIICGATAYPRTIDFARFRTIADSIGAVLLADISHIAGLIAAGLHPHPFPHADIVTTTFHKTLRGPRGAMIMCKQSFAEKIDKAVFPGLQGGPHNHVTAAAATALLEAAQPHYTAYISQVVANARALSSALINHGFTLVTGGTDTHLLLVDLSPKNITGTQAESLLDTIGLTTNKNMIPYDTRSPFDPSGIRLGTPAITVRGMKEEEMIIIADVIATVLADPDSESVRSECHKQIIDLCNRFPLYQEISYV